MTSKIKFVRSSLTKVSHPTTFLNKTKKISLNRDTEPETYVLTTKDTPIECITAEQDFNYFLAKGCRKEVEILNCALGFPFSSLSTVYSRFFHSGSISYTVQPGNFIRGGLVFYGSFSPPPPPPPVASNILFWLDLSRTDSSQATDKSLYQRSIVNYGSVPSVLNNALDFNGNTALGVPNLIVDSSNYTIEIVFENATSDLGVLICTYRLPFQANHLIIFNNRVGTDYTSYATFNTPITGSKTHLALVRNNGVYRTYLQGVLINTITIDNFLQTSGFYIGGSPEDNNIGKFSFKGKIYGLKITNTDLYLNNFTPPTFL